MACSTLVCRKCGFEDHNLPCPERCPECDADGSHLVYDWDTEFDDGPEADSGPLFDDPEYSDDDH